MTNFLKIYKTISKWPIPRVIGLTFLNGFLTIENKLSVKIDNKPEHFSRSLIPCNYDKNAKMSLLQMRFIMDLASNSVYGLNVIRLLFFNVFCTTSEQYGFLVNGPAVGSKSTLSKVIRVLKDTAVSSLHPSTLKQSQFHAEAFIHNKDVVRIEDSGKKDLENENTVNLIKNLTGYDEIISDKKHGAITSFVFDGILLILTNNPVTGLSSFDDPAIFQRLINLTVPALHDRYRVTDLELIFRNNPCGILNWALNSEQLFVKNCQRVQGLNKVLCPERSLFPNLVTDLLAFERDSFTSSEKVHHHFTKNKKMREIFKKLVSVNTLSKKIHEVVKQLTCGDQVILDRKNNVRGFHHLSIKKNEQLNQNQQQLKFKIDSFYENLLNEDPFTNHGLTIFKHRAGFVQSYFKDTKMCDYNRLLAKNAEKFSIKHLYRDLTIKNFIPGSHFKAGSCMPGPRLEK